MAKERNGSVREEGEVRAEEEDRGEEQLARRERRKKSKRRKEESSNEGTGDSDGEKGRGKKRKRKERRIRGSRRRDADRELHDDSSDSDSESEESSGDSESDSVSEPESEIEEELRWRKRKERRRKEREHDKERQRKEKERERRRKKEKEQRRRKREKRKEKDKEKKKEKDRSTKGAVTNSWGKYGVIKETDMWNKRPEFTAWLAEVKQVNLETLPNWEEKQMFKQFMEDHNTATFPSKKYYDLDTYHRRKMDKEQQKGIKNALATERTNFNDEEQRRQELLVERERQKEGKVESLKHAMQSGMAQAMKEQARLREEMAYQYKLGNFEAAAAIQKRLDPDVAM